MLRDGKGREEARIDGLKGREEFPLTPQPISSPFSVSETPIFNPPPSPRPRPLFLPNFHHTVPSLSLILGNPHYDPTSFSFFSSSLSSTPLPRSTYIPCLPTPDSHTTTPLFPLPFNNPLGPLPLYVHLVFLLFLLVILSLASFSAGVARGSVPRPLAAPPVPGAA